MRRAARSSAALVCLAIVAAVAFQLRMQAVGDPARGRRLFERGVDEQGVALVGRLEVGDVRLEGAAAACARCHGPGGDGTREAGVEAPPIDARSLRTPSDRRPALDDEALLQVIAGGVLPGGRRLLPAMPRYELSVRDRRDLVAWLRVLGQALDPGVGADFVRIGVLEEERAGAEVRALLQAFFAERGAIHGRRIELVPIADEREIEDASLFALAGGGLPQRPSIRERLALDGVPVVAPIGPRAPELGAVAFYLYPTRQELARVVTQQLLRAGRRPVVFHRDAPAGRAWLEGAQAEAGRRIESELATLSWQPGAFDAAAAALAARAADVVLFAGGWQ